MADEVGDSLGGAIRGMLYAIAFILMLLGGEQVLQHERALGITLILVSIPIFLSAVLWKWVQQKLSVKVVTSINLIAADPRWWLTTFLVALVLFRTAGTPVDWVWIGAAVALMTIFLAFFHFTPPKTEANPISIAAPKDQQNERDLLLLLHYAMYQSAIFMIDGLLELAPQGIENGGPLELGEFYAAKFEPERNFVAHVGTKLESGSDRHMRFHSFMRMTRHEAERQVKEMPPDRRPADIDPILLSEQMIAHQRCVNTIAFLVKEKKEVQENIRSQRHGLLERYRLRNPS